MCWGCAEFFARQRCPIIGVLRMCWLLPGSFDCFCCPRASVRSLPRCVSVCVRPRCPVPPRAGHSRSQGWAALISVLDKATLAAGNRGLGRAYEEPLLLSTALFLETANHFCWCLCDGWPRVYRGPGPTKLWPGSEWELLHRVRTAAVIRSQTPVHHPQMHPPKKPIEPQKTSVARHTTCLPRVVFFVIANSSTRRLGRFCSFLKAS